MDHKKTTEALTTVIGAGAQLAAKGDAGANPELTKMLERLAALLETDLQDQQAEKAAKAEAKRRAAETEQRRRFEMQRTIDQGKRETEAKQAGCQHRSGPPWNATEVRGLTMISGNIHLTCQACGKEWKTPEGVNWVKSRGLYPGGDQAPAPPPQPIYS